MALLTFSQNQLIKPISANNQGMFSEIQTEVENMELRELLGSALLFDLQTNPTTPENIKLLSGDTFTDCSNNNVKHRGLQFVLSYMIHSKYILHSKFADTFTGFVEKKRNETESISQGSISKLQENSRKIALSEFEIIKEYLNKFSDLYPLWNYYKSKKPYTPKFSSVRTTFYGGNRKENDINIHFLTERNGEEII